MKCIRRWDLGGTGTGSLSHGENHLCNSPPVGSLVVAVTAGSGPRWQKCSSSFMWTSLAEIEGHKGILRSSVSPKPCTYSAGFIGKRPWQRGCCISLVRLCSPRRPRLVRLCLPQHKITSSKHPYCNRVGLLIWGMFILKTVYYNVWKTTVCILTFVCDVLQKQLWFEGCI